MSLNVAQNNKGFTLVEVLIAFLITTIGLLALANVAVMSIDTNMGNMLRDEAQRISDRRLNGQIQFTDINRNPLGIPLPGLQTLPFTQLQAVAAATLAAPVCGPTGALNAVVTSDTRGMKRNYTVCWQVVQQGANSNSFQARVWVGWNYKGGNAAGIVPTGRPFQIGTAVPITKLATD